MDKNIIVFINLVVLMFFGSCGCIDDDPIFINETTFTFIDDSGINIFSPNGVFQNDTPQIFESDGITEIIYQSHADDFLEIGEFQVAFQSDNVFTENGESYVVKYPDNSQDTITVFYENFELAGSGCSQTNNRLVKATLNGAEISSLGDGTLEVVKI